MDELTSVFIQEGREQLAEMEAGLLQLEQNPADGDGLNGIFRAAHTIKGASGVVECGFIEQFMHRVENVLDALRHEELAVSAGLVSLLLNCCDHLARLFEVLESQTTPAADLDAAGQQLQQALQGFVEGGKADAEDAATALALQPGGNAGTGIQTLPHIGGSPHEQSGTVEIDSSSGIVLTDSWHISIRFGPDVLRNGMDPLSFLRYLTTLGEIVGMETLSDIMPAAETMDAETCYLGFEIHFQSRATKADIERVFDFVRDDCELYILPPHSRLEEYIRHIQELPEDTMRLGEILVRCGALTQSELDEGLSLQNAITLVGNPDPATDDMPASGTEPPAPPLGEILVEQKVVHKEVVDAAVVRQHQISDKKARDARMIRVQADKLDQLIDLVGELVIAGASANLQAQRSGQTDLVESTSILSRLVENIRDAALQLRMVQIGETFNRFQRVVRDVSKELGKEVDLLISGGETELDKSVVEKIGDPLMHLVRNALDHGIEPAALRSQRGKPERGRLALRAWHDSGSIVIEIADDGGGLNRDRIFAKAAERGLLLPGQTLSDSEIVNLIFEPGFSTAEQVSNLSGRGVGMDVVRRNIQALRGTVDVASREGEGTTFTIRLPLTLAIIDGFLVQVGPAAYVIPLDAVVECIEYHRLNIERNFLDLRGEVLPFIRLRELFGIDGTPPARENVVVVQYAGQKAGIIVDHLLGEFQTVIKPLGAIFRHLRGIGGSTILGSGDVALILDIAALVTTVSQAEAASFPSSPSFFKEGMTCSNT